MFTAMVKKVFGSRNERILRQYGKVVTQINGLEKGLQALSDDELRAKTAEFKQRYANGETLDDLLPEAFAVVRETSVRVLGMRHFDVQLIGGMTLHNNKIAEMRTGEGKTLSATLPSYLNAITGKGVHVITVNDYLAKRDSEWMKPIYTFLGMTVDCNLADMSPDAKRAAYAADITYGTNNEFGFDYLRDNMAFSLEDKVQRDLYFAVVDEVDSILIDEARTPLIISGPAEDSSELYIKVNTIIPKLTKQEIEGAEGEEGGPGDYSLDEKQRQAHLTEEGHVNVEKLLQEIGLIEEGESLYSAKNIMLMHHLNAALRANTLYQRDVDYIVQNNEVVIVDEHTGRTMPGRRWSEGLHQAVEAKEGVAIQNENQTLASITFQNYFRLYDKLSGMTGTADTEAYEFHEIYSLEVVVIPTNEPMVREDMPDQVFRTAKEKFEAIIEDIKDCQARNQPVLVGTASIESSEHLDKLLKKANIKHQVLNAKFHAKEAEIITEAGRPGVVTIATNMAGRGTDIVLGGNLEAETKALGEKATPEEIDALKKDWQERHDAVIKAGGLCIIGSERHESRRIDNQLRGRSGRQGDVGASRFYLSLEDNLMRIFAADRVSALMQRLGMEEGVALEHRWVNRIIENAQRKVEGFNFDVRKQLLQYDDVANDQRKVIYAQRSEIMESAEIKDTIAAIHRDVFESITSACIPPGSLEDEWDVKGLEQTLKNDFAIELPLSKKLAEDESLFEETLRDMIQEKAAAQYEAKVESVGAEVMRHFEKSVMLQVLDDHWRQHLMAMDHLRQGINLRGYAQKDPRQEYKREAFDLFLNMLENLKHDVISVLMRVEIEAADDVDAIDQRRRRSADREMHYAHDMFSLPREQEAQPGQVPHGMMMNEMAEEGEVAEKIVPIKRDGRKVGRNEACPCGSGKKFKQCHGKV